MRKFLAILATSLLLASTTVQAQSGGGGGGPSPYAKMETLTVNLSGMEQLLQINMVLKVAKPELSEAIKGWTPVIRHELILLLSSQKGSELETMQGKKKLMAAIKIAINKILKLDSKEGVTDVLFESFIIQ